MLNLCKRCLHNWSRNVLVMQIETRLLKRSGTAVTNFEASLPKPQSDLARESLKDPYRFDFLGLSDEAQEREAEYALGDKTQPMGIAEYKLLESLPEALQSSLPSIEQIESELGGFVE